MKFLFVIGVEGAGHDMIRALMQEVIKQPSFVLEGGWREMMTNYWSPKARYRNEFSFYKNISRQKIKNDLHDIIRQ